MSDGIHNRPPHHGMDVTSLRRSATGFALDREDPAAAADLLELERQDQVTDFHCVEGWSIYDVPWNGLHLSTKSWTEGSSGGGALDIAQAVVLAPLQALLHIMATGEYRGMDAHHPDLRVMFTRDYLLNSDWYHERLNVKQLRDIELWKRHVSNLQTFLDDIHFSDEAERLGIAQRFEFATEKLRQVQGEEYLQSLVGTLGADPLGPPGVSFQR